MRKRFSIRRMGRWISTVVCVVLIAPLTGCAPGLVGFAAVSSVYYGFIAFLPLRSAVGGVIRDAFVGAF